MTSRWRIILTFMLCATTAVAEPDSFGLGTGRDGQLRVTEPRKVINRYAQVTGPLAPGDTVVFVASTEGFSAGDLVMVLQTTGIVPEPVRGAPGPIELSRDPVGRWELARVASARSGEVGLTAPLLHSYAASVTQLIRVPEYTDVEVRPGASVVAKPWEGGTGGVLAFLASGAIRNDGELQASGAGFRGGVAGQEPFDLIGCSALPREVRTGARRGEGISSTSFGLLESGWANASNGGGGGLCPMSGGGGGGNGAAGGRGGDSLVPWDTARDIGGQGGAALSYSLLERLTLGGGGGGGHGAPDGSAQAGAGGGAIFIRGQQLAGRGTIAADGDAGAQTAAGGGSGGGAGGSLYLRLVGPAECGSLSARGGAGGSAGSAPGAYTGPGGGGGGGRVLVQAEDAESCPIAVEAGMAGGESLITGAPVSGSGAQPVGSNIAAYRGSITRLSRGGNTALAGCASQPEFIMPTLFQALRTTTPRFEVKLNPTPDASAPHTVEIFRDKPTPGALLGVATRGGTNNDVWILDPPVVALGVGDNDLRVVATCGNGQDSTKQALNYVHVDYTSPVTAIQTSPAAQTKLTSAEFTFKTTNEARESSFKCKLDNGPEESCGINVEKDKTSSKSYGPLLPGTYIFSVYAIDAAGNTGAPATYAWTVDLTPPETVITRKPSSPSGQSQAVFEFTGAGPGGKYFCKLGTSAEEECSTGSKTYQGLNSGSYTFYVYAVDAAGNVENPAKTYNWTVDVTPPITEIINRPVDPTNQTNATFTYSSTETGSRFFCQLNLGGYLGCDPTGKTYTGLTQGTNTFCVYAEDLLGNKGDQSPACFSWTVDLTPPITKIDSTPANPTNQTSARFTFSGAGLNGKYYCKLDEAGYEECSSGVKSYSDLTERVHTFCVYARDAAGNDATSPVCYTWVLDLTPPDTSIDETSKPRNPTNATSVTFRFSGAGTGGGYWCQLDERIPEECDSGSITYSGLTERVHNFIVYAEDAAGNKDDQAPATYSWQVDITRPDTTILEPKPPNPSSGSTVTFRFTGADLGGKYHCRLDNDAYAACNTGSVTYTVGQGPHTFYVYAEDAAGNVDSDPDMHTWEVDLSIPATVIDPTSKPSSPTNATSATFRFSGAGPGGRYRCKLDQLEEDGCDSGIKPYSLLGQGSHTFCVYAVNAAGTRDPDAECYSWEVDVTPPDTAIEPTSRPPNPTKETSVNFRFTSTGGGNRFRCTLGAQVNVVCDSGTFTATVTEGAHTFSVYAIDDANNADPSPATYTWTVDLTPPVTRLDRAPRTPTNERDAIFEFSGAEAGGTYQCLLDGTLDPCNSGSMTYSNLSDAPHEFCVAATDAAGNPDVTPVCHPWVIDVTAPGTVIDPASEPPNPTNRTTVTFRFTGAGPGEGYLCRLDAGQEVDCSSGSMTYEDMREGEHTFRVRAFDQAGNRDATPATFTWTVDLTPPVARVTNPFTEIPWTNKSSPSFVGTSESFSEVRLFIDKTVIDDQTAHDEVVATSTGEWSLTTTSVLRDGTHTVRVQAIDKAGNVGEPSGPVSFIVDTVAPDTGFVTTPGKIHNSRFVTFGFEALNIPPEAGATFECVVIEVLTGKEVNGECSGSEQVFNVAKLFATENVNGDFRVQVKARDLAGNLDSSPASFDWTVIVDPPKPPEILEPADLATVYELTPTISGVATRRGTVELFLGETKVGLVQVDEQGLWAFRFSEQLAEGDYSISGVATDIARNPSTSSEPITFTVRAPKPQAQAIGGGLGCDASGLQPGLALLGLIAGAVWNSRRRRC